MTMVREMHSLPNSPFCKSDIISKLVSLISKKIIMSALSKFRIFIIGMILLLCMKATQVNAYCNPTFSLGCTSWRNQSVNIGSINWSASTTCTNWDYTTLMTSITPGIATPMTVVNGDWCGCAVWVDLNNDNDFDDLGENLYTMYQASALNTYSFNITVPTGTSNGLHRMRVIACWGSDGITPSPNGNGPCGVYQYGNYDDFNLNVGGAPVCLAPTGLNTSSLTSVSTNVNWTAVAGAVGYEYVLDNSPANPVGAGSATTNTSASFNSLTAATAYYLHLRTNCGASFSNWTNLPFTTLTGCTVPTGLLASSITSSSATLSWTMVTGATGYEYVIDNVATNPTGSGTSTVNAFYNAGGLTPATLYYLHLRSDCGTGNYSTWTSLPFTTTSSCTAPSGLSAMNINSNSADISWNAVSGAIGYEYVLDNNAGNPSGPGTATTATTYSASALNYSTVYYIHVRTNCGSSAYSVWTTYSFTTKAPNGINDFDDEQFVMQLMPNPVLSTLQISLSSPSSNAVLQIIDLQGKILQEIVSVQKNNDIDVSNLANGIYLLKFADELHHKVIKFTKQ